MSTKTSFILYGVPLSQPTRSVAWAMLMKQVPFEFRLMVPGLNHPKVGARHENFRSKTKARSITVPLIEIQQQADLVQPDSEHDHQNMTTTAITESAAILMYLCESKPEQMGDLYGKPGTLRKASIDSYLHWHHSNTRILGNIASSYLIEGRQKSDAERAQHPVEIHKILRRLEQGWLAEPRSGTTQPFIAEGPIPSIADLLCYDEIVQITWTGLVDIDKPNDCDRLPPNRDSDKENDLVERDSNTVPTTLYPNLSAWMHRMQGLPYHDEIHYALKILGRLDESDTNDTPFHKRLARSTKEGLLSIQQAQVSYQKAIKLPVSKL